MKLYFRDLVPFMSQMLKGLGTNFMVATISLMIGLLLGLLACNAKASRHKPLRYIANIYIELIRNTPLLVQLYIIYFGIAQIGIDASPFQSTIVAMVLNSGAYIAEIMRSGFQSVSYGISEAGQALGMNGIQIFFYLRLAPAFKAAFPALINQYILMFLGSTVASTISLPELMYNTLYIDSVTARTVEVFLMTGILFYVSSFVLINTLRFVEKRIFRW